MRSKGDEEFGDVCDRIGHGTITSSDESFLRQLIRKCPNEDKNDMFREGKISIIVTTNLKRVHINDSKLTNLIDDEQEVSNICVDICTNIENAPSPPSGLSYT